MITFFAICIFTPVLAILIGRTFKSKHPMLHVLLINFIMVYLIILLDTFIVEWYLEYQLSLCDLNNNQIYSRNEMTPECLKRSQKVTNDTGRTFVPITGLFFALVSSLSLYIGLKILPWLKKLRGG